MTESLPLIFFKLAAGIVLLIKGADWLVDGSASMARRFGLSDLVIGLTIVSFGTSAPELVVNIVASFQGSAGIAVGNILGSNIANILLILGAAAVVSPLCFPQSTLYKELPFSFFAALAFIAFASGPGWSGLTPGLFSRFEGLLLLLLFCGFMFYVTRLARAGQVPKAEIHEHSWGAAVLLFLAGIAGLNFGGQWIVGSGSSLARLAGLSESLIGLTIVAVGTSLPELAASVAAAHKKNADMAVGNVVGSNVFNLLWVIGLSALIHPLAFNPALLFDAAVVLGVTFLLFLLAASHPLRCIGRSKGVFLLVLYGIYTGYLIYRG